MDIDPVRVEDEDGAEEEDEEGGRSVNQSNCCSSLKFALVENMRRVCKVCTKAGIRTILSKMDFRYSPG